MKKVFLPIIAFALSLSASAIPTTFNYQGVTSQKGEDVTVVFKVVDENGTEVYKQETAVKTNANGAFTALVGGEEGWDEINWTEGEYKLVTNVAGVETEALLQAVPYAKVAEKVAGVMDLPQALDVLSTDLKDLAMANRENKTDIAELKLWKDDVDGELENAYMTGQVAQTAYDMADANADAIAELKALDLPNVVENLDMMIPQLQKMEEDIDANTEAIAIVSDDLQGLMENSRDYAKVSELAPVLENLEMLVPQVEALHEGVEANAAAIELLYSEEDGPIAALNEGFTQLSNVVTDQGAELQGGLDDLSALSAQVADLEKQVSDIEGINNLTPAQLAGIMSLADDVAANTEAIANATDDLQGLMEKSRSFATVEEVAPIENLAQSLSEDLYKEGGIVDEIVKLQELNLPNIVENLEQMTPVLQKMEEDIEANTDAIANATDDLQGLMEKSRSFATVEEVAPIENLAQSLSEDLYKEGGIVDEIVKLQELNLPNVVENLDQMTPMLQKMEEDIEANTDAIANATSDIQGLVEASRDYAKVSELAPVMENLEMLVPQIEALHDGVAANTEAIEILFSEEDGPIASLQNGFTQLSNKVDGMEQDIEALRGDVELLYSEEDGPIASLQNGFTQLSNKVDALETATADLPNVMENLEGLVPVVETLTEDVKALQDNVELLLSEEDGPIADLNLGFTQLSKKVDALEAATADLPNVMENLEGLVPVVETLTEDVNALQGNVELLFSEEDGPIANLNEGFTQLNNVVMDQAEAIAANTEAIANATSDIQGLVEASRDYAKVSELAPVMENLEMLVPQIEALHDGVAANQGEIDDLKTEIATLKAHIDKLLEIFDQPEQEPEQ